jgi:hypothetical protein
MNQCPVQADDRDYGNTYRPELPPVPDRMRALPIRRGYPVPWFVAMVDGDYHFPTADLSKMTLALTKRLCWVCGQRMGSYLAFVVGPMCAVNHISSEPPSHLECATFSAAACPFLVRPKMKRVKTHPEGSTEPPGLYLDRNPGVALVWVTRDFKVRRAGDGVLFRMDPPIKTYWFAEGRAATRDEVMASFQSGLQFLQKVAAEESPQALAECERCYLEALKLVPA